MPTKYLVQSEDGDLYQTTVLSRDILAAVDDGTWNVYRTNADNGFEYMLQSSPVRWAPVETLRNFPTDDSEPVAGRDY